MVNRSRWGWLAKLRRGTVGGVMTKSERDRIETSLLALRRRLAGDVSILEHEAFHGTGEQDPVSPSVVSDPGDQGPEVYEHEFTLHLLDQQERALGEIDEALDRLRQGTYGWCEECRGAISRTRLHALPYTRHCYPCAGKLQ